MDNLKQYITDELLSSIETKERFVQKNLDSLTDAAKILVKTTKNGGKVIYFGNGGSAADAQHLAAEHVNRLRIERSALPAIAITTDTSIITSIANDRDFDQIFTRQLEAIGNKGDVAIGISTSGNSANVIHALSRAKTLGMTTVAFTGGDGGKILAEGLSDIIFNVGNVKISSRIQETHIFIGHILIELMDKLLDEL